LNLQLNPLGSLPDGLEQLPRWEDRACSTNELLFVLYGGVMGRTGLLLSANQLNQLNQPFWARQSFIVPAVLTGIGVIVVILLIFGRWRRTQRA
jgi:hypothetical protein